MIVLTGGRQSCPAAFLLPLGTK